MNQGAVYIQYCEQLLFGEMARQFAVSCSAISGKRTLRVAGLGFDGSAPIVNAVLGNYDRSALEYFGAANKNPVFPTRPLEEFDPAAYDCAFVFAPDLNVEAELWRQICAHRRDHASTSNSGGGHCSYLRFTLAQHLTRAAFFSLDPRTFHTCLEISKLLILSLALLQSPPEGILIECGSYKGGSAVFTGQHLKLIRQTQHLHAFDTFAGIPAAGPEDLGTPWTTGQFTDTSLAAVQGYVDANGLTSLVTLHPGLITETVPPFLATGEAPCFVFLDTDQYFSTKRCVEDVLPRLLTNGIILIDDAMDPGVARAITEIHQEYPRVKGFYPMKSMYIMYQETDANFNCTRLAGEGA